MRYKCVPARDYLVIDSEETPEDAGRSLAKLINREAKNGWKYHSMEKISVHQNPGCLGWLLGKKGTDEYFYMLIFSNESEKNNDYKISFDKNIKTVNNPAEVFLDKNSHESDAVDTVMGDKWICGECNTVNETYMYSCSDCGKIFNEG